MSERESSRNFSSLASLCKTFLREGDSLLFRRNDRDLEVLVEAGNVDESRRMDLYYALKYKLSAGEVVRLVMRDGEINVEAEGGEVTSAAPVPESPPRPVVVEETPAQAPAQQPTNLPFPDLSDRPTPAPADPQMASGARVRVIPGPAAVQERFRPSEVPLTSGSPVAQTPLERVQSVAVKVLQEEIAAGNASVMPQSIRQALIAYKREHLVLAKRPFWPLLVIPIGLWFVLPMQLTKLFLGGSWHYNMREGWFPFFFALLTFVMMFSRRNLANNHAVWPLSDRLRREFLPFVADGVLTEDRLDVWLEAEDGTLDTFPEVASRFIATPLEQRDPEIYDELLTVDRTMELGSRYPWFIFFGPLLIGLVLSHLSATEPALFEIMRRFGYGVVLGVLLTAFMVLYSSSRTKPRNVALLSSKSELIDQAIEAWGGDLHSLADAIKDDAHLTYHNLPQQLHELDPNWSPPAED